MQYTEEQLNEIKNKMVELEERLKNLDKFETESLRERMLIGRELNELSVLLLGEPIKENNSDVIGVGSKFNMTLKSEGYAEDTELTAKIAEYEATKATCVKVNMEELTQLAELPEE